MGKYAFIAIWTVVFAGVSIGIQTAYGIETIYPILTALVAGIAMDIAMDYSLDQGWF